MKWTSKANDNIVNLAKNEEKQSWRKGPIFAFTSVCEGVLDKLCIFMSTDGRINVYNLLENQFSSLCQKLKTF